MKIIFLNQKQTEAVNHYQGSCNVIATAGSGKTRVIVNRIANLVNIHDVPPSNILAVTYSKKAKQVMTDRVKLLLPESFESINIETFHSFGYRVLRQFSDRTNRLLTYDWQKQQIIENGLSYLGRKNAEGHEIATIISKISLYKNKMITAESSNDTDFENIFSYYERYKMENHLWDFDDMLTKCYETLLHNNKILTACQEQFRFVLIDEMQDINAIQYSIVKLLCSKYRNLFTVGDPLQNIYEWRGSDNNYVLNFENDWRNTQTINLNINYRSSKEIVDLANRFAKGISESSYKHYTESISNSGKHLSPYYIQYDNECHEAKSIAKKIKTLVASNKYYYKDFAVLFRTNAQSQVFESVFYESGIPVDIIEGQSFVSRKEIKIILSYLRLSLNLCDNESFEYVYNKPNRWLGTQFLNEVKSKISPLNPSYYQSMHNIDRRNWKFKNGIDELSRVIKDLRERKFSNAGDAIVFLRKSLNIDSYVSKDLNEDGVSNEKVDNLMTLQQIANKFINIQDFINYMDSIGKQTILENSVKLSTIHKSKGMEFPVVFLVGLIDGLLPHCRNPNINEEKRLVYVAITRAEKELYCSSTRQYAGKSVKKSPFVEMLFSKE